jgi:hypothetical protein
VELVEPGLRTGFLRARVTRPEAGCHHLKQKPAERSGQPSHASDVTFSSRHPDRSEGPKCQDKLLYPITQWLYTKVAKSAKKPTFGSGFVSLAYLV